MFLDEITEMPPDLQVKLLRVLETSRFMRVGSTVSQEADVRIIAATNRSPLDAVQRGRLREDLFYRLNVFPIELPPLRERLQDVPLLAQHFLNAIATTEGKPKQFHEQALLQLKRHAWPGNVRELRNAVQRAYVMSAHDTITEAWLPDAGPGPGSALAPEWGAARTASNGPAVMGAAPLSVPAASTASSSPSSVPRVEIVVGSTMAAAERALIIATLKHVRFNKEAAAAVLGVSLKTIYNRLRQYQAESQAESAAPSADTDPPPD